MRDNGRMFGDEIVEGIISCESVLKARELHEYELEKAFRLRYDIFNRKLGWIVPNLEEVDYDSYDKKSNHIGVFLGKEEKMIGYCRVILPEEGRNKFMIEEEFKDLLSEKIPEKENSLEISRVVVDTSRIDYKLYTTMLLYREIYLLSLRKNIRYGYIVVVKKFLDKLVNIFPFKRVGKVKYYQSSVETVAAIVDAREIESKFKQENNKLYQWFTEPKNTAGLKN